MNMGTPQESVIFVRNGAGDFIAFHRRNQRKTTCAICGATLEAGRGLYRKIRNAPGTGYICHICAGASILIHNQYMYNRITATLFPFDGVYSCYALPAAELAQAWHDHGTDGLRFAAETLREQARIDFLTARSIPLDVLA